MDMKYLYENWAKIGGIVLIFLLIMLFFNSKTVIGSYEWLFWLHLPLYMLHQVEEYVYPGGFKEKFNEILMGESSSEFPLTDKAVFYVNVLGIWVGFTVLNILGLVSIIFPLTMVVIATFNPLLHIGSALRFRKYNPGIIVGAGINLPLGLYILISVSLNEVIAISDLIIIVIVGIALHWLILMPTMIKWLRRKRMK